MQMNKAFSLLLLAATSFAQAPKPPYRSVNSVCAGDVCATLDSQGVMRVFDRKQGISLLRDTNGDGYPAGYAETFEAVRNLLRVALEKGASVRFVCDPAGSAGPITIEPGAKPSIPPIPLAHTGAAPGTPSYRIQIVALNPTRSSFQPEYKTIGGSAGVLSAHDLTKEYTVGDAVDTFTADGTTTAFPLSYQPLGTASINVFLNGVRQSGGYTLSGKTITFTTAPQVDPQGTADNVVFVYRGEFSQ